MKKSVLIVVFTIAILVLSGCGKGTVKPDQIDSIEIGMSISEVENSLGKPNKTTDDNAKISEESYSSYKEMSKLTSILANSDLENRMEQLNQVYIASESGKNVKQYTYIEKSDNGKRDVQIYLIGGKVTYVNKVTE